MVARSVDSDWWR